jgi:hypothetical protein
MKGFAAYIHTGHNVQEWDTETGNDMRCSCMERIHEMRRDINDGINRTQYTEMI